jgi:hypothetical protein
VHRVGMQLITTLFYFQIQGQVTETHSALGNYLANGMHTSGSNRAKFRILTISGRILCRLRGKSRDTVELGKYMKQRLTNGAQLIFVGKEQGQFSKPEDKISIPARTIHRMISKAKFEMPRVSIPIAAKSAITEIALLFDTKSFPISGFPRSLFNDVKQCTGKSNCRLAPEPNFISKDTHHD